jgi:hypothetical protein
MSDQNETRLTVTEPITGEVVAFEGGEENLYQGISRVEISDEAEKVLSEPINPDDIEVRPDGQIYYPEMKYRVLLNKAFGRGKWGIRPVGSPMIREGLVMQTWALYIGGKFVSQATGECMLVTANEQMTYGDILEGAKSVALRRLCKDLGIASELWDRSFVLKFLNAYCVKVWVNKKSKPQWRKIADPDFYGEYGIADDSPNKDKWQKPVQQPKEEKSAEPQKVKPDKPTPNTAPVRPYDPETVKAGIHSRAEKHATECPKASEKFRGVVCHVLESCFDPEDAKAKEKKRHSVLQFLTGKDSIKEIPDWYIYAIRDWLKWTQDSGDMYIVDPLAAKEARKIVEQVMKDAGQQEMKG